MEQMASGLSKWFYLGLVAIVVGIVLIFLARGKNGSKMMENGYFLLIIGCVGVISEWTNFATVLFILVIVSGLTLLLNKFVLVRSRKLEAPVPHYVHYSREFFPIVLVVWVLRAFIFEAYQIPSSSMRPDLTVGDFILVNKFDYGIRNPFTNRVLIPVHQVKRGDVVVFEDPQVRNRDLIKRVVGLGGDKIEYYNKRLTINGVPLTYTESGTYDYSDNYANVGDVDFHNEKYVEDLMGVKHQIITFDQVPSINHTQVVDFKNRENCTYSDDDSGFTCVVPQDEYFMMGDNRDNSYDGRYWGFVKDQAILGRAFYVWLNLHDFSRIGTKI